MDEPTGEQGWNMSQSYSRCLDNLFTLQRKAYEWIAGSICVTIATSLTDDEEKVINLTTTLGHGKYPPRKGKRNDSNCYWLSRQLSHNNEEFRQANIYPIFIRACASAGFKIFGSYSHQRQAVYFTCFRSQFHNEQKNQVGSVKRIRYKKTQSPCLPRSVKSQLPIKMGSQQLVNERDTEFGSDNDEAPGCNVNHDRLQECSNNSYRCKFKFSIFWDDGVSRWFLPHQQNGCIQHSGHTHIDPSLIRLRTKHVLDQNELQVSKDSLSSKISATATAGLIETRTGIHLEWHQVQYLQTKDKNQLVMNGGESNPSNATAVDRLIADLSNDKTKSFIMLFAEKKSGLLTVKEKRFGKNRALEIDQFKDDLGDLIDNPESYAESLRDRLVNTETGEILLMLAWASDESRRKFDMFPEIIGGDDTEDTNSEERPLYTLCGKDGNNEIFVILNGFMPCKGQWAFTWLVKTALPHLHPGTALARVRKINSDADPQETRAIEAITGTAIIRRQGQNQPLFPIQVNLDRLGKVLPNALHGWCLFHKLDRNLTSDPKYKSIIAAAKDKSILARAEIDMLLKWLWYFAKHYESVEEIEFSKILLNHYLTEDQEDHFAQLDDEFRSKLNEFITKSYMEHGTKLFDAYFPGMTLGFVTTGINESWHRAVKHHINGPKPMHDLAESAGRVNDIEEKKEHRKSKRIAYDASATFAKEKDRKTNVHEFTDYCNEQIGDEHGQAHKHFVFRFSENAFYVKRDYKNYDTTPQQDLQLPLAVCQSLFENMEECMIGVTPKEKKAIRELKDKLLGDKKGNLLQYQVILYHVMKYVLPRFERTRVVTILQMSDGEYVLVCDCPTWEKKGWACRHIFAVLKRYPTVTDAKIRWHIGYAHTYGRDPVMSQFYSTLRDKFDYPGIPVTADVCRIKACVSVGEGDKPLQHFTCSLGKLRLRGANYWQSVSMKFPPEIRECFSCEDNGILDIGNNNGNWEGPSAEEHAVCVAGFAPNQQIRVSSQYMVPSQSQMEVDDGDDHDVDETDVNEDLIAANKSREEEADNLIDNPTNPNTSIIGGQGLDAYHDFMPMYQGLCKLANASGSNGIICKNILRNAFNTARTEMNKAVTDTVPISGMASLPEISKKRKHIRKQKVTSPAKNKGKMK